MENKKKTYKTKEVNIVRLSAFYEERTSKLKETKKELDSSFRKK
tara:strand:+ start:329 stop:460 length:132 start_codon:yes stop_codon:yes gene_type:complete